MTGRGPGRRRGSPDTRTEILDAARRVFSEVGFDRATIRGIAREAAVDPALIHHYFGTKHKLFAASIDLPMAAADAVRSVFAEDREQAGRRLAETFFSVWDRELARATLLGILRSAMGGEDRAVEAFRQFLTSALLDEIAPQIPGKRPRLRALLMASQLVGVAMTRYVMKLEPIASAPVSEIIDLVAPRLQSYVEN
ncbi:MAG TPA: TetR family transcriptional regulator [Acidimicrobiia bacterium]